MSRRTGVTTPSCHLVLSPLPFSGHKLARGKSVFGDLTAAEHLDMRVLLLSRLNAQGLKNMPGGFPFRHVHDTHGSFHLSLNSYEFQEDLGGSLSSPSSQATIAFVYPTPQKGERQLTWYAYFPTLHPSVGGSYGRLAVAQVQVDSDVLKTPYGQSLMDDPAVILRALALSLEYGVLITIQLGDLQREASKLKLESRTLRTPLAPRDMNCQSKLTTPIVYLSTNNDGKARELFIIR